MLLPSRETPQTFESSVIGYVNGNVWTADPIRRYSWADSRTVEQNLANYKYLIWTHQNATTEMLGTRLSYKRRFGEIKRVIIPAPPNQDLVTTLTSRGIHLPGPGPGLSFTVGLDQSSANNIALMKFIKYARKAQRSLQGGVAIAELKETIHLVKNPLFAMRKYLSERIFDLEKGRRRKFFPRKRKDRQGALLRTVSDQWLETSFGIRPFMSDIADASQLLWKTATDAFPPSKAITAKGLSHVVESQGLNTSGMGEFWDGQGELIVHGDIKVRYYGDVVVAMPSFGNPKGFIQQAGLSVDNFVPTLWEALPWSFLVDYFTNVGEILEAFSFSRADLRWISRGSLVQVSNTFVDLKPRDSSYPFTSSSGTPGYVEWTKRSIHRERYTGSLIPSLEFSLPGKDSIKWLNIAALIGSRKSLTPYRFIRSG